MTDPFRDVTLEELEEIREDLSDKGCEWTFQIADVIDSFLTVRREQLIQGDTGRPSPGQKAAPP